MEHCSVRGSAVYWVLAAAACVRRVSSFTRTVTITVSSAPVLYLCPDGNSVQDGTTVKSSSYATNCNWELQHTSAALNEWWIRLSANPNAYLCPDNNNVAHGTTVKIMSYQSNCDWIIVRTGATDEYQIRLSADTDLYLGMHNNQAINDAVVKSNYVQSNSKWIISPSPYPDPAKTCNIGCSGAHQPKHCVTGYDIVGYKGQTVPACADLCAGTKDCVAFGYGVAHGGGGPFQPGDCRLQASTDSTGCDGSFDNLDLYVCCPDVPPSTTFSPTVTVTFTMPTETLTGTQTFTLPTTTFTTSLPTATQTTVPIWWRCGNQHCAAIRSTSYCDRASTPPICHDVVPPMPCRDVSCAPSASPTVAPAVGIAFGPPTHHPASDCFDRFCKGRDPASYCQMTNPRVCFDIDPPIQCECVYPTEMPKAYIPSAAPSRSPYTPGAPSYAPVSGAPSKSPTTKAPTMPTMYPTRFPVQNPDSPWAKYGMVPQYQSTPAYQDDRYSATWWERSPEYKASPAVDRSYGFQGSPAGLVVSPLYLSTAVRDTWGPTSGPAGCGDSLCSRIRINSYCDRNPTPNICYDIVPAVLCGEASCAPTRAPSRSPGVDYAPHMLGTDSPSQDCFDIFCVTRVPSYYNSSHCQATNPRVCFNTTILCECQFPTSAPSRDITSPDYKSSPEGISYLQSPVYIGSPRWKFLVSPQSQFAEAPLTHMLETPASGPATESYKDGPDYKAVMGSPAHKHTPYYKDFMGAPGYKGSPRYMFSPDWQSAYQGSPQWRHANKIAIDSPAYVESPMGQFGMTPEGKFPWRDSSWQGTAWPTVSTITAQATGTPTLSAGSTPQLPGGAPQPPRGGWPTMWPTGPTAAPTAVPTQETVQEQEDDDDLSSQLAVFIIFCIFLLACCIGLLMLVRKQTNESMERPKVDDVMSLHDEEEERCKKEKMEPPATPPQASPEPPQPTGPGSYQSPEIPSDGAAADPGSAGARKSMCPPPLGGGPPAAAPPQHPQMSTPPPPAPVAPPRALAARPLTRPRRMSTSGHSDRAGTHISRMISQLTTSSPPQRSPGPQAPAARSPHDPHEWAPAGGNITTPPQEQLRPNTRRSRRSSRRHNTVIFSEGQL